MFDVQRFQQLRESAFGENLLFLRTTESTNLIAIEQAKQCVMEGTVVLADCQTQGRGRGAHSWFSPDGLNLYLSIVLYPKQDRLHYLPFFASISLAQTLEHWQIECDLKWPNDVLHDEKKMAGILIQTASEENQIQFAVVGLGVNLNIEEFPAELNRIAVSAFQVVGSKIDREAFLAAFLSNFERIYRGNLSWDELVALLANRSSYLYDCEVEVNLGEHAIRGTTDGLESSGGLIVKTSSGREIVHAGEVSSCRKK
jgi:BirA family transcriptional regulator, biotin operon repressor / biotin---[acetyl-CoA-carboxylase] ligase